MSPSLRACASSTPPGSFNVSIAPPMPAITDITFAPTSRCALTASTGLPRDRTKPLGSLYVSTTSATSRTSTGPASVFTSTAFSTSTTRENCPTSRTRTSDFASSS